MNLIHKYDTEIGEEFTLFIECEYAAYHPADMNGPAEGGCCEDIEFTVIGYRKYDEEGIVTTDWPVLTDEREKELTDKFHSLLNSNNRLQEYFQRVCDKHAERAMEPDYD